MSKALEIAIILTAYDKATRVINDAVTKSERKLKDMKKASQEAFGTGMAQIGAGLAIAAPLALATKKAVEFEDAMADVAKVMNITVGSGDFVKMGNQAKDVAEQLGIGANEAAKMMANLAAGGVEETNLKEVSMLAGKMGIAFNMTADEAGTAFVKIGNALNQPIGETKKLMDQINMLSDSMASEANEIVNYMASGGSSVAASFNIAGAASAAFGSTLISIGKSSSEAATIFERLNKGIYNNAEAMEIFKGAGSGAAGVMAVLEAANKSGDAFAFFEGKGFGQYSSDFALLAKNINLAKEALDNTADATKSLDSVQNEFNNRSSTTAGQMRRLKASFDVLVIDLGNMFIPILQKVVDFITPIVKAVRDWSKENPELTKGVVAVVAAISGMMIAVGIFNMIKGAVLALNVVLMMNPFILIATAAVVAATLIYTYWDQIKAFFVNLWANIKALFAKVVAWFKDWGILFIGPVALIFKYWGEIKAFFSGVWDKVKKTFSDMWEWVKGLPAKFLEIGKDLMQGLWDGIKAMAYKPVEAIQEVASEIKGKFKDLLGIRSPSRVFMEFGAHISGGAASGVKGGISKAQEATRSLAGAMVRPMAAPVAAAGGGGFSINYSPTVTITGAGAEAKADFMAMLRKHQNELMRMINDAQARKERARF